MRGGRERIVRLIQNKHQHFRKRALWALQSISFAINTMDAGPKMEIFGQDTTLLSRMFRVPGIANLHVSIGKVIIKPVFVQNRRCFQ